MPEQRTANGIPYDPVEIDAAERRFWRQIWDSVPTAVRAEHGIQTADFGPLQATIVTALAEDGPLNLVFGAAAPGGADRLEEALAWARSHGVDPLVTVTPGLEGTAAADERLRAAGLTPGYAWMKFVRDVHPPRFKVAGDVEVIELDAGSGEPFGMIAATGFGMPAWAAAFFAELPGRAGWRCYGARVDGELQACGAMHIHAGVAQFGIGATLESARRRGCQLALLHRRIVDAAGAGCRALFVETGERVPDRPSTSYRNIRRAGFEAAFLRPNWRRVDANSS
jgi:hypothetical protein